MKMTVLLSLLALVFACNSIRNETAIPILLSNPDSTGNLIENHNNKDVIVYRINQAYAGSVFCIHNNKMREYKFLTSPIGAPEKKEVYDKAFYEWTNDTTVVIRLTNFLNSSTERYKMVVNGDSSLFSIQER
jgi:hypothetical protein